LAAIGWSALIGVHFAVCFFFCRFGVVDLGDFCSSEVEFAELLLLNQCFGGIGKAEGSGELFVPAKKSAFLAIAPPDCCFKSCEKLSPFLRLLGLLYFSGSISLASLTFDFLDEDVDELTPSEFSEQEFLGSLLYVEAFLSHWGVLFLAFPPR
jgi:hypothetical protein